MIAKDTSVGRYWSALKLKFKIDKNSDNWIVPRDFNNPGQAAATSGILQRRFKSILNLTGLKENYTFHSCKRGGTTTAFKRGLTEGQVTKLGRWKSKDMANLYNRPNTTDLSALSQRMLKPRSDSSHL